MSESTVRREKLVNPVSLLLIGLVFSVAFILLLPGTHTFRLIRDANVDTIEATTSGIDDLEFAYLKARSGSGELTSEEFNVAAVSLLDSGQIERLETLLGELGGVELTPQHQERLNLERAVKNFEAAGGEIADNAETETLKDALHAVVDGSAVFSDSMYRRLIYLSRRFKQHDLVETLYSSARENVDGFDEAGRLQLHTECGDYFAGENRYMQSLECYYAAVAVTDDNDDLYGLQLKMLPVVSLSGNPIELDRLISKVTNHHPKSIEQQEELATALLASGRPELAYPIYDQLSSADPQNSISWLRQAVKWAQAAAEPDVAATYQQRIINSGAAGTQSSADQLKLRELLVAAGENEKALEQIYTRLDRAPGDLNTLKQGVSLAMQLNLMSQAKLWNEELLGREPDDIESIRRQVQLSLGTAELEEADRWANIAVALEPDNIESRKVLAQVAEWSGRPEEAQEHWTWVSQRSGDSNSISQIVRLAEMNFRPESAADASTRLAKIRKPGKQEIEELIRFHELDGRPADAAKVLREIIDRYGRSEHLLSRLAQLNLHHSRYTESLAVWDEFEKHFKPTTESRLARTELNWRLNKPKEALAAATAIDSASDLKEASDYHIRLLSELAWQNSEPELGALVEPQLGRLRDPRVEEYYLRRRINDAVLEKNYDEAFELAEQAWLDSGETEMALLAMDVGSKSSDPSVMDRFLLTSSNNAKLRRDPRYWTFAAVRFLQQGEIEKADDAYRKAIAIEPENVDSISGLLWQQIGSAEVRELTATLEKYESLAKSESLLWSAYAVGWLQAGDAHRSLQWFEKTIAGMESDYSMMLTFSDALEAAGQAETAFKVRRFTISKLRPILAAAARDKQIPVLRQYASLVSRYGGAESSEAWTRYLVEGYQPTDSTEKYWQEDVGIAWLMSTQRHEHARLIMSRLHEQRLIQPAWQKITIALHDNDHDALEAVLASNQRVTSGNRMLALAALGENRQALQLARRTLRSPASLPEQLLAEQQYVYLRGTQPSYSNTHTNTLNSSNLDTLQTGLSFKHTFAARNLGVGLELNRNKFSSGEFDISENDQRDELILTLTFGNERSGGSLVSGYIAADDTDVSYLRGRYSLQNESGTQQLAAELAYNEPATQSPALKVAALQNRASLEYDTSFGTREYARFRADINEIITRVNEAKIANGVQARGEVGIRGTFGSNTWSTGVSLSSSQYNKESGLPIELQLSPSTTTESVLADRSTSLALVASLSRGGVTADFPQTTSPRYFANGTFGHTWPEQSFGLQFEGGLGVRILGGDELSLTLSHDAIADQIVGGAGNTTGFGLNYRYHFKR